MALNREHRADRQPPGSPILDALIATGRSRQELGQRLGATDDRVDRDLLGDIVRHGPVLEALRSEPLNRREIESRLDVSRATSHRFIRWLDQQGFVRKVDSRFQLTGQGEAVADELLRFEANVRTVDRLAPLLDLLYGSHPEFPVEAFLDANLTVARPEDPYRPVERFLSLLGESATLRGFNTTNMAPVALAECHRQLLEETDAELIYLPQVIDRLVESHPARVADAIRREQLVVRTGEERPYGIAIFDDRVGIGGYDESTGLMAVFVDTDAPIVRVWAEWVYTAVKAGAEPLGERIDLPQ